MDICDRNNKADEAYGSLRMPTEVKAWEAGKSPVSKVMLDDETSKSINKFKDVAECRLFSAFARSFQFIWVMDRNCAIWIAYEELVPATEDPSLLGHPRRRGFPSHPSEEKKLGHPTLINGGEARAAGELYLDEDEADPAKLIWQVNVGSGRYCRDNPPTAAQCEAIHKLFRMILGESVHWDDL